MRPRDATTASASTRELLHAALRPVRAGRSGAATARRAASASGSRWCSGSCELHGGRCEARSDGPARAASSSCGCRAADAGDRAAAGRRPPERPSRRARAHPRGRRQRRRRECAARCCSKARPRRAVAHDGASGAGASRASSGPKSRCSTSACRGMNGYEVAASCASDPELKHTALVAITGYGQVHDRARTAAVASTTISPSPWSSPRSRSSSERKPERANSAYNLRT